MYRYDEFDHAVVAARVEEFRSQVDRRVSGALSEEQFKPLRLMNGVYLQLHAYMLRVAIPYGQFLARQMRTLAHIARTYDKGYGHFTTRQNIQYNWPRLSDIPDILDDLAAVEMHAMQTSGNCIRNTTSDPFAGVAADEIADPRPWAEMIRQWSTLHPEFAYLPRKFKIAVSGGVEDRAAVLYHDIGLRVVRDDGGAIGFKVFVGGGLGRTPRIGRLLREFLAAEEVFSYLTSILRVYNLHGRRDNKYKARIKILLDALGVESFREQVEAQWEPLRGTAVEIPADERARIQAYFQPPEYLSLGDSPAAFQHALRDDGAFATWVDRNVTAHKIPGYAVVTVTLKPTGGIPGDISADQMDAVADLADRYSFGEIRATKDQNLVLADVQQDHLYALWLALGACGLSNAHRGTVVDMICCPGLDYCTLASARSIPVAQDISQRFDKARQLADIGPLSVNISGCINACGHHHAANIGILGLDRRGEESYQLVLGGDASDQASIAESIGPGFSPETIADAVDVTVKTYLAQRKNARETFIETYRRIGKAPFKEALNAAR